MVSSVISLSRRRQDPTISSPIPKDEPGGDPIWDHDRDEETYNKPVGISRRYSHQRAATLVNGSIDEPLPLLRYFALRRRGSQKYRPQFPIQRATAHSLSIQVHQNYSIIYIEKVSLARYTKSKAKRDQKKPSKPTNKGESAHQSRLPSCICLSSMLETR